jgi:hypothetical protein
MGKDNHRVPGGQLTRAPAREKRGEPVRRALLTVALSPTIIDKLVGDFLNLTLDSTRGGGRMIRKLIIIAILAAIGYGVYYGLNESNFFGTRSKERKTFEDVEGSMLEE